MFSGLYFLRKFSYIFKFINTKKNCLRCRLLIYFQWQNDITCIYRKYFLLNKLSSLVIDCIRMDFHNKNKYKFIDISQYNQDHIHCIQQGETFFKSNFRCMHNIQIFCFYYIMDTNRVSYRKLRLLPDIMYLLPFT